MTRTQYLELVERARKINQAQAQQPDNKETNTEHKQEQNKEHIATTVARKYDGMATWFKAIGPAWEIGRNSNV